MNGKTISHSRTVPTKLPDSANKNAIASDVWYVDRGAIAAVCGDPYEGVNLDLPTLREMVEALESN